MPNLIERIEGLLEKATPGPWEATMCGDPGIYTGLTVKSPGHIRYKACIFHTDADDLEELQEELEEGTVDHADLRTSEQALLQTEDNLQLAAELRNAAPAIMEVLRAAKELCASCPTCGGTGNALGIKSPSEYNEMVQPLVQQLAARPCSACGALRSKLAALESI